MSEMTALYETENNAEYLDKACQTIDLLFPECEQDDFIKSIKKRLHIKKIHAIIYKNKDESEVDKMTTFRLIKSNAVLSIL